MITTQTSPSSTDRLDSFLQELRVRGCRLTPQRAAILRVVLNSPEHPTTEQVYEQVRSEFPMTSLATVYNTLALLKEMGVVLEISLGSGGTRYDGLRPEPHPHLICTRCQTILDADLPALQAVSQEVTQTTGFQVTSHRFDFFGICPQCQQSGTN